MIRSLIKASTGRTETGALMSSARPKDDKLWDYMSILPSVKAHIWMKPVSGDTYELVCLDGLKAKIMTNSDDPPGSFYTKDVFTPHSAVRDRWKYIGRLDDRITLNNGEKIIPIPFEDTIRQHCLVSEAVMVGIGKELPGLFVFRSDAAKGLSNEQFVDAIWDTIQTANARAEAFSQISRDTVVVFNADVALPHTDKGTIMRARFYKDFAQAIEMLYQGLMMDEKEVWSLMCKLLKTS